MEGISLELLFLVAMGAVFVLRLVGLLRTKLVTRRWISRIPVDVGVGWRHPGTLAACRYSAGATVSVWQ